ncbi:hypothetical protein ACFCVO_09055 [Agromyces sp. NPDC056379]|uniref:hypothetical protein n=1 Tax=unclassified Agromyces TaxID=2639701 RepID=UPI0035E2052F
MSDSAPTTTQGSTTNFRLLGVISFVIGAGVVLVTRLLGLAAPLLISTGLPAAYELISGLGLLANVLSLVLGIAALVLGVLVLLRRGAPKGFAAAGAALGGAEVLSAFIGFGQTAFYSFL